MNRRARPSGEAIPLTTQIHIDYPEIYDLLDRLRSALGPTLDDR